MVCTESRGMQLRLACHTQIGPIHSSRCGANMICFYWIRRPRCECGVLGRVELSVRMIREFLFTIDKMIVCNDWLEMAARSVMCVIRASIKNWWMKNGNNCIWADLLRFSFVSTEYCVCVCVRACVRTFGFYAKHVWVCVNAIPNFLITHSRWAVVETNRKSRCTTLTNVDNR